MLCKHNCIDHFPRRSSAPLVTSTIQSRLRPSIELSSSFRNQWRCRGKSLEYIYFIYFTFFFSNLIHVIKDLQIITFYFTSVLQVPWEPELWISSTISRCERQHVSHHSAVFLRGTSPFGSICKLLIVLWRQLTGCQTHIVYILKIKMWGTPWKE